jgi:hypothetical protein
VVEHPPLPKGDGLDLMTRRADPGYFSAIQIPLLRGRIFTLDERLERGHVTVISQSAAQLYFPGEDPIGKHLQVSSEDQVYEVVGVVGDTRWSISQPMRPTFYEPLYGTGQRGATMVIRSAQNVETLAVPVQKIIGRMDPDLPVGDVMTLRETIGKSTVDSQFDSILVLAFAVIALLLAAAGLYGVLAYLVTQRTSEIGIRIALGAQRGRVLRVMLLDGLRPAFLGLLLTHTGCSMQVESGGRRHTPASKALSIRAQILEEGGQRMWNAFMTELRHLHLETPAPRRSVFTELETAFWAFGCPSGWNTVAVAWRLTDYKHAHVSRTLLPDG